MRGVHAGLADGSLTPAAIDAYVRGLFDQLAEHEAALRDASAARGRIAADDRSAPPPSARQQLLAAARAQALAILGLDPAALVVREAPGRGEVRAGVDDDGRIAVTVPEHFTDGSPIDAVDLGYALEDHRDRAERRPADVTRPDPAKPWDADREAAYRGRAKAEPGYRWELAPDGTLRYVGHPPRLWSPAHGRFARDPAAPVTPRRPRPTDAPPKYRDEIVPDFYAGTDPDAQIAGWQIDDEAPDRRGGVVYAVTTIKDGPREAIVRNSFTPATAELSLDVHFFHQEIPTKVPTQPAMAAGLSPTAIFFTLRQMRQLGIEPGTLRRLRLHQIQNIETVLQVDSALRALGASLADPVTPTLAAKLEATALGLYARTIARQSGHVITGVELGGGRARWKLGELMAFYEGVRQASPTKAKEDHAQLLAEHGVTKDSLVTTDFDLVFLLEDAP